MDQLPEIDMGAVVEQYEVLLFDAFGVLIHSKGALPGAVDLIHRLNADAKPYFVLTNDASKLPSKAAERYQGYGLDIAPDRIVTSGSLLENHFAGHRLAGARCAVLGPADSLAYVEHAGGRVVASDRDFDVLVIADEAGFPLLETLDAVFSSMCRRIDRRKDVHLILPNPDVIYPKDDKGFGFSAGGIAGMFEAALHLRYPRRKDLRFIRLGKPEVAIFEEALSRSGTRDMVMIGDQLETDIQGARGFGLDAVWIKTGVSVAELSTIPTRLRPTYCMKSL